MPPKAPGPDAFPIDDICEWIASGDTFAEVARNLFVQVDTLRRWIEADEDRSKAFKDATRRRAHTLFDQLDQVCAEAMNCRDKVQIQAYKLKIDTIKWKIAKLAPKEYGERQQLEVEHSGSIDTKTDEQVDARVAALLAKARGDG